jgi:transposase-like protein
MLSEPKADVHYPGRVADLRAWFPDDAACLDYLDWLRWPDGFVCPHCRSGTAWQLRDGRYSCGGCKRRVSVTAGTVFHGTRTPLTVWFEAAWLMMTSKAGVSAVYVQRVLGLGSYQTAWAMLHRYRDVMIVPERDKLSGVVEMDETYIGGVKAGKRGRGAAGKVLVAGAIERAGGDRRGFGRARLEIITSAKSTALREFITANIAPGTTVISDALSSYPNALAGPDYEHDPINIKRSGLQAHQVLPGVHRLFSLSKRWLEGTHQGRVEDDHLQSYMDEFIFRFNRRTARQRGLLFLRLLERAVQADPIRFVDIVANPHPAERRGRPPGRREWPTTLAVEPLDRPWRRAE